MNNKELAELLKYSHPKQLYIVAWNNALKLLFCPFKVKVLQDVGGLKKDEIVLVDEVKVTHNLKTVFVIKRKSYYYYHFDILTN